MTTPKGLLKVALLTTSIMRGGAETQVFLIAKELSRRGHLVKVISMRDPEAYEEELAELNIELLSLGMRRGVPDPRAVARLARILADLRPDVLHSHMVHANLLGRVVRLLTPVPVQISTAHSIYEGGTWRNVAYRLTDSLASLTTNVCQAGVDRFVKVGATPRHKIRRVVNGLEVDAFERTEEARQHIRQELLSDPNRFVWLAVGSLEAVKDYPLMLRSFRSLQERYPAATLWIVSGGPKEREIRQLSAGLGFTEEQVRFLGIRKDVAQLMSAADAFVLTSRWEGLPMVLLEASIARLPVVATRVGGVDEVVMDGETGLLVEAGDHSGVTAAMVKLMAAKHDDRATMGTNAREHALRNFRIESVVDDWTDIYRELLQGRRRGGD